MEEPRENEGLVRSHQEQQTGILVDNIAYIRENNSLDMNRTNVHIDLKHLH